MECSVPLVRPYGHDSTQLPSRPKQLLVSDADRELSQLAFHPPSTTLNRPTLVLLCFLSSAAVHPQLSSPHIPCRHLFSAFFSILGQVTARWSPPSLCMSTPQRQTRRCRSPQTYLSGFQRGTVILSIA